MKRTLMIVKWFAVGVFEMLAYQVFAVTAGVLLGFMCGLDLDGNSMETQNFFGSFVAASFMLGAYAVITNLRYGNTCPGEELKAAPRWLWQLPFIACGYLILFHGGAHVLGTTPSGWTDLVLCLSFGGLMSVILEFTAAAEPTISKAMIVATES